ncbi:MAG: ABC transporter permease [Cyclobacteriaceae bacterium]|nr:ABC transporter permease [Cyclobacteriaceae bacterium SS2]
MNLPYFISSRITKNEQGSFSSTITRIAIISIAVALSSLILAFLILGGYENVITSKIYSFSGHVVVSKYTLSNSVEETSIMVSDTLLETVKNTEGVDYVQAYSFKYGLLSTQDEVQGVLVKGIDENFNRADFEQHLIRGRFPEFPDENYGTEVAISEKISNILQLDVGDEVTIFFVQKPLRFRKLQITGVYETGLEEIDENVILGDIRLVSRINNWEDNQVGGLEVYLEDPNDQAEAAETLFDKVDFDMYVEKVSDKYIQIFEWLRMLNRNVLILLIIVLFVACFNMVSILLILILERTQMIGIFKSLGASNALIRRIFLFNGLNLIVKGLLWGNFIGLSFCLAQYYFRLIPLDASNYYVSYVPISLDFGIVLLLNVMAILVVGVTLFIPLSLISRIQPVKAIRFD